MKKKTPEDIVERIHSFSWICCYLLFFSVVTDFSTDFALLGHTGLIPYLQQMSVPLRILAEISSVSLFALGCARCWFLRAFPIRFQSSVFGFLFRFLFFHISGAAVGLLSGVEKMYVLGDSRHLTLYIGLLALLGFGKERHVKHVQNILIMAVVIIALKIMTSVLLDLYFYRAMSARYLVKSSPIFIVATLCGLAFYLNGHTRRDQAIYFLAFLVGAVGVFLANVRGYFLGLAFGFLVLFALSFTKKSVRRGFELVSFVLPCAVLFPVIWGRDFLESFFSWNVLTLQSGIEYRQNQTINLLGRFWMHPLLGEGLGAYDPAYEGHRDGFSRPYLVELEYLNLLAKSGIVGISIWMTSFLLFFKGGLDLIFRTKNPKIRIFTCGLLASVFGLMVASFTNTLYSSILFHLCIIITLVVINGESTQQSGTAWKQTQHS